MIECPQLILLDAVGTLFGVRGSVGEQYASVARRFGLDLPIAAIDAAFGKSFKAAGTPAFGFVDSATLQSQEYHWWFNIAVQTFKAADCFDRIPDFDEFFTALFAYFAAPDPWFVYPEVTHTLQRWQAMKIPMGIVSNFDSRLYAVLESLQLSRYFTSITISTEAGVAKPDPRIFAIALQKHNCSAQYALHIGDSFLEDYQAAKFSGLQAIWLKRV